MNTLLFVGETPVKKDVAGRYAQRNRHFFTLRPTGSNGDQVFTSLAEATSTTGGNGLLVGGGNSSTGIVGNAWMLKVVPAGNSIIWNTVIKGNTNPGSGKIHGVRERWSAGNLAWEYYGACAAQGGTTVYKLDDTGQPFNTFMPGSNDEFVYNAGSGSASYPTHLTFLDNGGGNDIGLHIYGNLDISGPGAHYLEEAYFSGESGAGCNTITTINSITQPTFAITSYSPANIYSLSACNGFTVTSFTLSTYQAVCGPTNSIPGASNNKISSLGFNQQMENNNLVKLFPNPVNNSVNLEFVGQVNTKINVDLYNSMGQFIKTIFNSQVNIAGKQLIEINFESLELENGIYFLTTITDDFINKQKVVYIK